MATQGRNGRNGNGARAARRRARRSVHGRASKGLNRWLGALLMVGILGFIAGLIAIVAAYAYYQDIADALVAPDELAINQPSFGAKILDRNGKLLYEYVDDRSGLRRPIKLADISDAFLAATIATEDDSFFTNPGINIRGLARAAWENSPFSGTANLFSGSGGSSITQQLVKNVYIGQETVSQATRADREISDLKTEITRIQTQTGVVRPFDNAAETEALLADLQLRQRERPTPALATHLDLVSRLLAKQKERDRLEKEILEQRQTRSVERKLKEIVYAIELTNRYSKEQILEWYVNQISYGGVYNGVQAASLGYFGKPASELTLSEAALLAGIPQSPAAYDPVNNPEGARRRRDQILDLMHRQGRIRIGHDKYFELTEEQLIAAKAEPVEIAVKRFPIEAPHFVLQYVQPQLERLFGRDALFRDGLIVTTTLDLDLQHEANNILERWILEFERTSGTHNGATMVLDPRTGEVLAMVGSRDYFREDIQGKNNNVTACNSPGSSFKPFAYLTTFLELGWGPGTLILDTPVTYKQVDGTEFVPTNPGKNFQGPITIRNALGNSLNIPANKAAAAVGPEKIVTQARKMGFVKSFRSRQNDGCSAGTYGPAIATGGVDITLEEMVFGYSVFANGGMMRGMTPFPPGHGAGERKLDPIAILKVEDAQKRVRFDVSQRRGEERVVKPEFTYLISNILSDPSAQCITFGCGGITVPGRQVAVKTGTSEPFDPKGPFAGMIGETWTFGYTPDIVVGVWAGNSDNTPIRPNIFSTSIAFRAMRDTLQAWYAGRPSTPFERPEGVVEETVCVPSGKRPTPLCGRTTRDIFAKDSLPKEDDTWWQRVRIDGRTGLLATPSTPPQFVQEQVMLAIPRELMQTEEDRKQWQEWADTLGIPLAPTDFSPASAGGGTTPDLPAAIFSPVPGQTVTGQVTITGRASTTNFLAYTLEYGAGVTPTGWQQITQSTNQVASGPLGTWNTQGLAPGIYTLRLVVVDRSGRQVVASVTVSVGAPTPTPVATSPAPRP
ncbi:MAG TPA: transglycosylase domain-containing protein [Dehalococcoidia bacterium]|nr:transglycosylase domain-containing protein [Dehalococcoidia bacterium]